VHEKIKMKGCEINVDLQQEVKVQNKKKKKNEFYIQ